MDVHVACLLGCDLILLEAVLVSSLTGLGSSFSFMLDFASVLLFCPSFFMGGKDLNHINRWDFATLVNTLINHIICCVSHPSLPSFHKHTKKTTRLFVYHWS